MNLNVQKKYMRITNKRKNLKEKNFLDYIIINIFLREGIVKCIRVWKKHFKE